MGSQAVYNARVDAPKAIVIRTDRGWQVATPHDAHQVDRRHGGMGPVVVVYKLNEGLPYRTEHAALIDATLIVAREEEER